ncbi:hypothetical protein VNI00_010439 [Paramarasmius palmivorus]|uniref:RING-type domain-containing protein n=1 Tax=Paramarasmius palmivorus TaxID=297713 RepID=A0AAW0CM52_9AGAR
MDSESATLWQVETIECAEWAGRCWLYLIKWYGYETVDNTYENPLVATFMTNLPLLDGNHLRPYTTAKGSAKSFGRIIPPYDPSSPVSQAFEPNSDFPESCLAQCQTGDEANRDNTHQALLQIPEAEPTKAAPAVATSFKTHSGIVMQVPDASLLSNPPEALGLDDLNANDRYQTVLLSLKAKKVDAHKILYKKAKNDSKEDPSWRRVGCSICYDCEDLDDAGRLLACRCRSHIYCKTCVETWIKKSRVLNAGALFTQFHLHGFSLRQTKKDIAANTGKIGRQKSGH